MKLIILPHSCQLQELSFSFITVVKNREQAAALLVDAGIIGSKDEIPSFLGGMAPEHPDEITKNLPRMISSLLEKMQ